MMKKGMVILLLSAVLLILPGCWNKEELDESGFAMAIALDQGKGEMKQAHGMVKAKYTGLFGMEIQAYPTSIVVNVKRMIRLIEEVKVAA